MGVFDKIKNALFEVEYVEVDEPSKPEKKKKNKKQEKIEKKEEVKPIAKKVVLPGKEEKVKKLEEEELKDDNFETRPKNETIKEDNSKSFKFMDDNDFKVDDYDKSEPEIVKVVDKVDEHTKRSEYKNNYNNNSNLTNNYAYQNDKSKPYGLDKSYKIPTYEYGKYEKNEEKKIFKPSPIISPIYGILDKNYKKEDVVQKKEVRITSSYTRSNVSVDEVRDKALGVEHEEAKTEENDTKFSVDDGEDDNLLVDLTDDSEKPEVKELTMGDALEYFQDLGLEYNVDYLDANNKGSQNKVNPKISKYEEANVEVKSEEKKPSISEVLKKEAGINKKEEVEKFESNIKPTIIKNESIEDDTKKEDDNLFDLIENF